MKSDLDADKLREYCKKSYYKGRSRTAVFIDKAFIFAVIGAAVWLAVRSRTPNLAAAILIEASIMLPAALISIIISELLFERHIKTVRKIAGDELKSFKLLILSRKLCRSIHDNGVFVCLKTDELTADDLLAAYEKGCDTVVSPASLSGMAKGSADMLGVKTITPFEYLKLDAEDICTADDNEIDELLSKRADEIKAKKQKRGAGGLRILSGERAPKFFCCGILLLLMSLFMRYALYYRVLASVSLLMGTAVLRSEALISKKKEAAEKGGLQT